MKVAVIISHLTKSFGQFVAIADFCLEVQQGSIVSILAPSAAGKTTLLRTIAGLERPTAGKVLVNGSEVKEPSPDIGFMFQQDTAFPWLTVRANMLFGLRLKANRHRVRSKKIEDLIFETAKELNIESLLERYPSQLSGGQKQRVVIARSLILQPTVLLCDEPFSALDEATRRDLRDVVLELHQMYQPTVIFITHNIEEAIYLGDRVIICSGPPLRIVSDSIVQFSQPRSAELLESKEFREVYRNVREIATQRRA